MNKNLRNKIALIIAVLLIFVYGIFGIPHGVSGDALKAAIGKNIHLGLDLRGGAHLILQVAVQEAVNEETDDTVAHVKDALKAANLTFSQVYKPDPVKQPTVIRVEGIAPGKSSDVSSTLDSKYSNQYDLTSVGADNSLTMTMNPPNEAALEEKTDQQAIDVIRDRVDTLCVSEP
jgi:preprotein translocase subunit SecD